MASNKGPVKTAGEWAVWIIIIGILIAILSLWSWDIPALITAVFTGISDFFLQFEWFRDIFGR